ncbi:hypothetical protein [Kingella potus]|uniref:hypothetical protein n=1 Tax=Kingella potus TaxID=265175 RepID=UPI001FD13481|nr:hypothetical protein [Kingella potus]UOP00430.1 hypothetical protein LVJ84_11195 [Kingella potus]
MERKGCLKTNEARFGEAETASEKDFSSAETLVGFSSAETRFARFQAALAFDAV